MIINNYDEWNETNDQSIKQANLTSTKNHILFGFIVCDICYLDMIVLYQTT